MIKPGKLQTMRFDGRRFGYKVGDSEIGVKEYFDTVQFLTPKISDLEGEKEKYEYDNAWIEEPDYKQILKRLDALYRRLRAVESRTWTPMESFVIDRPSEDEINLETFVKGHVLARIEKSNALETDQTGQSEQPQALRAESKTIGL